MQFATGVVGAEVALISDGQYLDVLFDVVQNARHRVWSSVFIVDPSPWRDRTLAVDRVLFAVAAAAWRGADARLLIGGSRSNTELIELADAARRRALSLGIPSRWLTADRTRGSHAKFVVADDVVLCGSHNWSPSAMHASIQDSLLVRSRDLASYLAALFDTQWARAETEVERAAV